MMKILGWLLLIGGFGWIGFVSVLNPTVVSTGWSDEMARYTGRENFTRKEVFDAMHSVAKEIDRRQRSPLEGGIAMFIGACLTNVPRRKRDG